MGEDSENIIFGGPVTSDYTKIDNSLGGFILRKLTENGDKIVMIDGKTGQQISCNEIKNGAMKITQYFYRMGLKKGDVIGVASENSIQYSFVVFGAFFVGATVAAFNPLYTEDELHHALNLSKPKIVFGSPLTILNLSNVSKKCSFITDVVQFGYRSLCKKIATVSSLVSGPKYFHPKFQPPTSNLFEDVAFILLSSGTTGLPKGVELTHANILASLSNVEDLKSFLRAENVVLSSIVPWFHVYGMLTLLYCCCIGVKCVMTPKFEDKLFLGAIDKYKVTHIDMVPPIVVFLAKSPLVDQYNMSSLEEFFCAAAPLSKDVEEAVLKRIPNVKAIRQGYGMSELAGGVLGTSHEMIKTGSVGVVGRGLYCKVLDPKTGKALGPYKRGELCFKGRLIMKGYIDNEKATNEMIDKEGWLHTGDVGYYDEDKHFFIVDRLKELIKYKAFQVAPAELEDIILSHPNVQDVAVIGKPDEYSGELPMAFVVKQPNSNVSEEEIVHFVARKVSPSKRLRGGVQFIEQIPKTSSGKILRRDLKGLLDAPKSKL